MNHIETFAINNNCSTITLKVEKSNTNSIQFFKKWGFNFIESLSRDIGNGFRLNGFLMKKEISF